MEAATLLRTARQRRGLTQVELARRAGTSQPVISAYEHGRRDPTTATLRRLLAAAGERLELRATPEASTLPPARTPEEHAARLVDVLLLTDAVDAPPRAAVRHPRIVSRP